MCVLLISESIFDMVHEQRTINENTQQYVAQKIKYHNESMWNTINNI